MVPNNCTATGYCIANCYTLTHSFCLWIYCWLCWLLRKQNGYELSLIGNADQTPLTFDNPYDRTLDIKRPRACQMIPKQSRQPVSWEANNSGSCIIQRDKAVLDSVDKELVDLLQQQPKHVSSPHKDEFFICFYQDFRSLPSLTKLNDTYQTHTALTLHVKLRSSQRYSQITDKTNDIAHNQLPHSDLCPLCNQSEKKEHVCWPKVSEQFLNGTSAQYRLYSAIQIKS